jgi:hypothetical protein
MKRILVVIGLAAFTAASQAQVQYRNTAGESDPHPPQLGFGFAGEQDKPGTPQLGFTPQQDEPGTPQLGYAPEQGDPGTPQLGFTPQQDEPGTPQLGFGSEDKRKD